MDQAKIKELETGIIRTLKENPELMKFFDNNPEYLTKIVNSARQKAAIAKSNDEKAMDKILQEDTKLLEEIAALTR